MHPAFHSHVAALGLVTTTTSPTWMLSAGKNHFGLDPICGKYSCMHCCQTWLTSFCTLHQHVLGLKGLVSKLSGTKSPTISPIRKWFGVNQIRSPKMHTGKVDFHLLTVFNSILSNAIKFITHRENAWLNLSSVALHRTPRVLVAGNSLSSLSLSQKLCLPIWFQQSHQHY